MPELQVILLKLMHKNSLCYNEKTVILHISVQCETEQPNHLLFQTEEVLKYNTTCKITSTTSVTHFRFGLVTLEVCKNLWFMATVLDSAGIVLPTSGQEVSTLERSQTIKHGQHVTMAHLIYQGSITMCSQLT